MAKKKKRYGYKDGDENARFAPGGSAASEWEEQQRQSFTMGRTINPSDTSKRFNTEQDIENYKPIKTETYQSYMASKLAQAKANNPKSRVHITANDLSSYSNARAKLYDIDPTANLMRQGEFTSQYKSSVDKKARLNDMVQLAQGLDLGNTQDLVRKSYNDLGAVEGLANTRTNAEGLLKRVEEYRKLYGDSKELKVLEDRAKGIADYINTNAKGGSAVSQAVFDEANAPVVKSMYDKDTQTRDEIKAKNKAISDANIEEKYGKAGDLGYEGVKNIKAETPAEADWKEEKQLQLDPFKKYEDNKKEIESLENDGNMPLGNQNGKGYEDEQEAKNDRINALREQNTQILSQYAEDIIAKANLTDDERRKLETGRSFDLSDNEFRWDVGDKAKNEVTLNRKEMIDVLTKRGISKEEASLLLDYENELDKENERQAAINAGELRRRTDSEIGNLTEDIARTIGQPIISPLERVMGVSGEYAHAEQLGRQQAREKYYEDDTIGQALYDFGETAGTIVGSSLLGGAAAVPFTTKAVEDSYYNALDKGASESDAMNYAATNGIMTGIIYGIGLKGVNKLLSKSVKGSVVEGLAKEIVEGKPTSSLGKAIIKSVGTNAVKEGGIFAGLTTTTQVADTLNQVINLGNKSDFNQMVEAYKQQGMSEDEAWQNTVLDISKQIGQGAAESFASGAIMGAGGALIGNARQALRSGDRLPENTLLRSEEGTPLRDSQGKIILDDNGQPIRVQQGLNIDRDGNVLNRNISEEVRVTQSENGVPIIDSSGNQVTVNGQPIRAERTTLSGVETYNKLRNEYENARVGLDNIQERIEGLWDDYKQQGFSNPEEVADFEKVRAKFNKDYVHVVNKAKAILGEYTPISARDQQDLLEGRKKLEDFREDLETVNPSSEEVKAEVDELKAEVDTQIDNIDTVVETQEVATADIVVPEENAIGKSKSGKPIYIDEVNGTDVTFVDSEGKKVTDYELDDTPQTELMELAIDKDYDTDTTKSMMKGFELANTDNVEAYADNYDVFYAAGKDSSIKNFKDALAKAPELTSALEIVGTDAAGKAFSEGRKQVSPLQQKGLTKLPKGKFTNDTGKTNAATEYAEMFAIFSGGDVVATERPEKFISSKVEPGSIRGVYIEPEGKIIIDTKYTSFIRALNHEFGHLTDNFAIDEAEAVSDACMKFARESLGIKGVDDAIKNLQETYEANGQEISYTEAQNEFIKNIIGTAMASPEGIEGLVGEFAKDEKISAAKKQSIISKFIEWIKNLIAKLKVYAKEGGTYEDTEFVLGNKEQRQDIINKQIDALKASRKILEEMSAELEGTTDTSEKFSLTKEQKELSKEYNNAVKNNDMEKAAELVKDYAASKGYTQKVYHGTTDFGFTNIDLSESDDSMTFWTTNDPELAQTYSGYEGVKEIKGAKQIRNLSPQEKLEMLKDISTDDDFLYLGSTEEKKKDIDFAIDYIGKRFSNIRIEDFDSDTGNPERYFEEAKTIFNNLKENPYSRSSDKLAKKLQDAMKQYNALLRYYIDIEDEAQYYLPSIITEDLSKKIESIYTNDNLYVGRYTYKEGINKNIINEHLYTEEELDDTLIRKSEYGKGNYQFYANTNNFMKVDAQWSAWNKISYKSVPKNTKPEDMVSMLKDLGVGKNKFYKKVEYKNGQYELTYTSGEKQTLSPESARVVIRAHYKEDTVLTRDIAEDAKNQGYDGVVISDVIDDGGYGYRYEEAGDVYIFFDPTAQVKSADPVTYDDKGDVVPLEKRFDKDYNDIRFSIEQPSEEKLISDYDKAVADNDEQKAAEIVEQYAKSKGYTERVYHGTESFGFTQIDLTRSDDNMTFWATDDVDLAQTYSGKYGAKPISKRATDLSSDEKLELYKEHNGITSEVVKVKKGDTKTLNKYLDKQADILLADVKERASFKKNQAELKPILDRFEKRIEQFKKDHNITGLYVGWDVLRTEYEKSRGNNLDNKPLHTLDFMINDSKKDDLYIILYSIGSLGEVTADELDRFTEYLYKDKGNYQFLADTSNFEVVDAKGKNWNKIESGKPITDRNELMELYKQDSPLFIDYDPFYEIYYDADNDTFVEEINDSEKVTHTNIVDAKDVERQYQDQNVLKTRDLAAQARAHGKDGLEIKNVIDNGGRGADYHNPASVYIFFNPVEQVKSADPITYDDNGNVIPLQERFRKDHDDIRFSIEKREDDEIEVDAREKELKDANKILSDTMLELRDKRLNFDSANKIARDMKKNFNIDLSNSTIKGELSKVTDAIQSAKGNINSPKVQDAARDFIKNMMRYSKGEIDEYNQSILDNIKKTPILLSDDLKSEIQDYGYWFRLNQGKIMIRNNGIPLDRQWVEWADQYPAIFDATISDKDQPYELEKIINTLSEGIPFDDRPEAMEAYKTDLLLKIAKQLDVNNRNLTKAYNRVARLLNNDYKKRVREALREQRDYHNAEIAEMKLNEKLRGREQRIRKETTKVRRDNIKLASKLKRAMTSPTTKNRVPFVLQEPLINFLKVIDAGEQKKIEYYNKQIGKLQDQLKYATGSQYDEILNQIDELKAKKGEVDMESAFIALERDYKKAADELEANGELSQPLLDSLENLTGKRGFSESAIKGMSQAAENFGGRTIYDLYLPEQKELNRVLKMLQTEIKNYNKIIDASIIGDNGQALHISQVVQEGAKQIRLRDSELAGSDNKAKRVVGKVINKKLDFSTKNLRPDVLFNKLFGYHKNNLGQQISEMLEQGNIDMLNTKMAAINELNKMFETKEDRKHAADIQKYDSKHLYNIGIPNADGKEVRLPKSMIIQIKLHLNNERNRAHLIGGGLTIPNFEKYIKTGKGLDSMQQIVKGTDARVNAINKKIANELNKEKPDFEKIKGWDMDIEQILSEGEAFAKKLESNIDKLLNPWDKRYIETHYKIFDGILKEKLNEKTKLRFGTDLAQEEYYTRLISDPAYLNAMADGAVGIELNQEEAGFMKQRTGARNPIILESCLSADLSQIEKSAKYVGFLIPQHNLNRILKFTSDTEGGDKINLTKVIQQNYPSALDYIDDFKLSVFGGKARPQHNKAVNAVMSIRAIEGLVANVNVELLQSASYPLAASEISYSSLLKALMRGGKNKHPFSRADRELIDSKTPYLWARAADSMTEVQAAMNNSTAIGNLYAKLANNKYGAYLVGRISKIDNATVGRLWYAAEFEVQKNNPRLKKGSEEYYKEVAKIFNKATITTQPMYDALHRNEYQRSNNAIVKMLEMFKTVLVQSYNTVYDKQSKYNQFYKDYKNGEYNTTKEDVKKARKERNRAVVSWLVSMSLVAGIRAVIYSTLYHQAQDSIRDENGDITIDRVLKYYADSLLNSFSGAFLLGSDLTEAFEKATDKIAGYDNKYHNKFSLAIVDIAQDALDIIGNSPDLFDEKKRDKYLQDTFNSLVRTTGMPYKNTKRLVDGIIGIVEDFADNGEFDYSNELEGSQELRKWAKGELGKEQVKDEMTTLKVGNAVKKVYLDKDITKEQAIEKLEASGLYKGTSNRSLSSVLEGKVEKWDIDKYKDEYLATLTSGGAETAESRAVIQKITNLPYSNAFYSDSSKSHYKNYASPHDKLIEHIKSWNPAYKKKKKSEQ